MTKERHGALAGLKVIDLTTMLAGPYCTMMLADQGADVIKVEPPSGDGTRRLGPFMPDDELKAFGGYFHSVNRNKRSIALNLKDEADRDILLSLVADADVLVENYRVGVMERLGLGYETLAERNPRLVYACLRGFGDPRSGASPYVEWPAYDVVAQAAGGIMAITGSRGGQPMKIGPGVGDLIPAIMLAFGIAAAVRHAEHSGMGQFVDVGMYDAILALCERTVYQHSYTGAVPGPEGDGHPLLCPFGMFRASDGWVSIAANHDMFWCELTRIVGQPDLATDPRYATNAQRVANRDAVESLLTAWTERRTKREIAQLLGGKVPFGPVNTIKDNFADPHVRVRQMLVALEQPGSSRKATIANTPIRMSATPGGVWSRAPLLDEHRDEILPTLAPSRGECRINSRQAQD